MDEVFFKKMGTTVIVTSLAVLSFFLLKPILLSIIVGVILSFIFNPLYVRINKIIPSKNLSAILICGLFAILIIIPFWFLTPLFIDQSIKIYFATQEIDFVQPLKILFPTFFSSEQFANEVGSVVSSFITSISNRVVNMLSDLILNLPTLSLQFIVVFFTFFYVLRDQKEMAEYIKSLLPFPKEVEQKLFNQTKGITSAVIYGQIIIGLVQGLILAIGLFIFGIENALFLSLVALFAGILPIIGTAIVWIPVVIYFLISGDSFAATGILIFGLISSTTDNFLRPMIVSQRTSIHTSVILIGMIGGVFLFGVLGLLLGPLILAYLLTVLELYRSRKAPGIFLKEIPQKE